MPFYGIFNELWTNSCIVNGKSIKEGKFFDLERGDWGWLWGELVDIHEIPLKLGCSILERILESHNNEAL